MKTIRYENEAFWQITDVSAIRPEPNNRLKVLTFEKDGSVKCITRKVIPSIWNVVKKQFEEAEHA